MTVETLELPMPSTKRAFTLELPRGASRMAVVLQERKPALVVYDPSSRTESVDFMWLAPGETTGSNAYKHVGEVTLTTGKLWHLLRKIGT